MYKKTCLAVLFLGIAAVLAAQEPARFDLLIRGGTVVDGSGRKAFKADVAVRHGKIVRVGRLGKLEADEVIDASGLIIAPGFIDVHTHADELAEHPAAENFVRMGVTTVVAGNCGGSALNIAEELRKIDDSGAAVNFATLIGHNTVRRTVMGTDRRPPTSEELEKMKALVARAMAEGAIGLSTGLEYVPGTYAGEDEIIELAKVAAAAGGIYASHMRNEGTELEKAVAETIRVGKEAGCPVEISHLKVDSPSRWGISKKVLAMIDEARRQGIDVRADQYGYTAASSGLGIRFPSWALEGGREAISRRLDDPDTWRRIRAEMKEVLEKRGFHDLSFGVVASYRHDPSLNGLSIKEISLRQRGAGSLDDQLETARAMLREGGAQMVYHLMSEDDIARFMRHPQVAVASDSSLLTAGEGMPHPRGYGNNPRILGHYVRELKVIRLEEAVRKMTSLPATQFRLGNRGLVKEGYAADLVLFDRNRVADRATYENPHQYPSGIPYVLVNGSVVIREGNDTGARPGKTLAGPGGSPGAAAAR